MTETARTMVVPMPHMGVSVEEGTVVEWRRAVGDTVSAEDVICDVATDKVDFEVVAPADGTLVRIVAKPGENVAVGRPLAELHVGEGVLADLADGTPRGSHAAAAGENSAPCSVSAESITAPVPEGHSDQGGIDARAAAGRDPFGRFNPKAAAEAVLSFAPATGRSSGYSGMTKLASPVAKRMAQMNGVDLGAVKGRGRNGRIRKVDVEQALAGGPRVASVTTPHSAPVGAELGTDGLPAGYEGVPHEVVKTTRTRQAIAAHMVRSRQTAAHMTTEVDVDLGALVRVRADINIQRLAAGDAKLSFLPFIARVTCVSLGDHPELNATFLGERVIHWQGINLGVAVDTPEGLMVPVVKDCDRLTTPAIGDAIADLAERARSRKLVPDDLAGGTFTVSNPGSVGAVSAPAIINQPQVALLGVPAIQRRPWVIADGQGNEAIAIRPILRLAVTFDHRAVDGAGATRFAVAIKERLEAWGPEAYS
jgi:pyruvate dehydrogenase E2 component (dihydrolipoamide acetyltransferase)